MSATPFRPRVGSIKPSRAMSTWSRVIESFEALPAEFKEASCAVLADAQPFPYVVYAPDVRGLERRAATKLVANMGDTLYIWEYVGRRIQGSAYSLAAINMLEAGRILLYSWITVSGLDVDGVAGAATVTFNSISTPYYEPITKMLRPRPQPVEEARRREELAKFDYLEQTSYKFRNFARDSLVPGEEVINSLWQPLVRKPLISLFGWTYYRTLVPAHLAILTDRQVIFIDDDPRLAIGEGGYYGGIWQYVPLRHIAAVELAGPADDMLSLTLTLGSGGQRLEKRFMIDREPQVRQFQQVLQQLMGERDQA